MADNIDKSLPNNREGILAPKEQIDIDVDVDEIKEQGPIEVTEEEDGGVTLDFEPGAVKLPGTEEHFDNLADLLPDDILDPIRS